MVFRKQFSSLETSSNDVNVFFFFDNNIILSALRVKDKVSILGPSFRIPEPKRQRKNTIKPLIDKQVFYDKFLFYNKLILTSLTVLFSCQIKLNIKNSVGEVIL